MTQSNSPYTYKDNPYLSVPSFFDINGPVNPYELLNHTGALEMEIGFGRGRFVRMRAQAQPDTKILGIETKRKLVYLCAEKAKSAKIDNLMVMHGDAREVISRMEPNGCFDNIFVNFPDPWWKAKHQKRMVVTDALTEQVIRMLKSGGGYFVQTDVEFRAQEYQKVLLGYGELNPLGSDGLIDVNPFEAESSREHRCKELEMPIYRLHFIKK